MKNHFKMIRLMMLIFILPMASSQGCCDSCVSNCVASLPYVTRTYCAENMCNYLCSTSCSLGYYRVAPACSTCVPCPYGTYIGISNVDTCIPCNAGTYTSITGSTTCYDCTNGVTYQETTGQKNCWWCSSCQSGTYLATSCTTTKNTVCPSCPAGTYSQTTGASSCTRCFTGTYQELTGQSTCKMCSNVYCPVGTYYAAACTLTSDIDCRPCSSPTTTVSTGQISCNACVAGYYRNAAGSCLSCDQGSGCIVNTYKSCPGGIGTYQCVICSGYTGSISGFCQAGQEPNQVCTGTQTVDSYCKPCAAGYYKSSPTAVWCSVCETGYYQSQTGQSSCIICPFSNVRIFLPWGTLTPTSMYCPYNCIPGYRKVSMLQTWCSACTGTGIYATGTEFSCEYCTNKPSNSYYLAPVKFNYGSNNCPWDCNAGFYKTGTTGTSCISCPTGTYRSSATNILVEQIDGSTNKCLLCSGCQENGVSYKSTSCTSTSDTVCFTCKTQCNAGYYKTSPCKDFQDLQCKACNTTCPVGYYLPPTMLQACTGQTTTDVVQAGCLPCYLPSQCAQGEYLSGVCKGKVLIYNIILSSAH